MFYLRYCSFYKTLIVLVKANNVYKTFLCQNADFKNPFSLNLEYKFSKYNNIYNNILAIVNKN